MGDGEDACGRGILAGEGEGGDDGGVLMSGYTSTMEHVCQRVVLPDHEILRACMEDVD